MTEVINFFQTIFMFKNFAPARAGKQEVELAVELKNEAQILAVIAGNEVKNGQIAEELAAKAIDENKTRVFIEIAVWHNNRAAEKYHKAAARFGEAGKVYTKKGKAFNTKAKEMTSRAAQAEAKAGYLNNFLKQN